MTPLKGIAIVFIFTFFSSFSTLKNSLISASFGESILSLASNWDNIKANTDLSPDNISSWLPQSGIRGKYEIARKHIGLKFMEQVTGHPVFLEGPHQEDIDFNSESFGHYNPRFLERLKPILREAIQNKLFVESTKTLYDAELKQYLRTFFLSYNISANRTDIMEGYLRLIAEGEHRSFSGPSFFLQEAFRAFAESAEESGYDVYEGFTCPGFWIRRSIDGTEGQFYNLLLLVMETYDTDFLKQQTK